jgi:hypothetical protein
MEKICQKCGKRFGKPYSRSKKEWKLTKYCSHSCANSVNSDGSRLIDWMKIHGAPMKGKKRPDIKNHHVKIICLQCGKEFMVKPYRKRVAKYCSTKCSELARDEGKSSVNIRIRKSKDYIIWRTAVFVRDNYTCKNCNRKGGYLCAHHIKPFALYPELRFAIDNGLTLCERCHKQTESFGRSNIFRNCVAVNTET